MQLCSTLEADSYQLCTYEEDHLIPFAPDGNAPLIAYGVEKVKGVSGKYKDLRCVRKTLPLDSVAEQTAELHQKQSIAEEVKILRSARHHHVIELIHAYFDVSDSHQQKFAIVMDRAEANLHSYLKPGRSPPLQWFACLTSVVCYVHSLGIRHRDIKPSNILVKGQSILLADFGISQMGLGKTVPTTYQFRNSSRTRQYCAPEVDRGSTRGRSADIFSLGAVFLEMFVACFFPGLMIELNSVLKPTRQSISSYANQIEEVHEWMNTNLHSTGWQHDLLGICTRMLHVDRYSRPCAEDLEKELSLHSAADPSLICNCAKNAPRTKCEELIEACKKGPVAEVKALLAEGVDPKNLGAILFAAVRGEGCIVQALLDAGAPVDIRNAVGQTALHCASRNGHHAVIKQLLDNGADVNAKDDNCQTALHGAAGHGYEAIIETLLDSGADVFAEDLDGSIAAHFAVRRRHSKVGTMLECRANDVSEHNS